MKSDQNQKTSKEKKHTDPNKLGMDLNIPSNYENSLGGFSKNLIDFEVEQSPGRL